MSAAAGVPWRPLVAITVVVACVHALALRGAPGPLRWQAAGATFQVALRDPEPMRDPEPASRTSLPVANTGQARPPGARVAAGAPRSAGASAGAGAASRDGATVLAAVVVPQSASWHYAITAQWRGVPVLGDAVLAWRHDGTAYDAALALAAPPLPRREQRSTGELAADGLRPLRFAERLRSEEATHFDRERDRIAFSSNRPDAKLQAGAQDRLSVLLQLAALAAGNPGRFEPGASVALQVAGTRDAGEWRFTVDGHDELALATGTLRALKLTRAPQGDYAPRLEVWLDAGRDYAPARLRLTAPNGDWLDMQWSGTDKR